PRTGAEPSRDEGIRLAVRRREAVSAEGPRGLRGLRAAGHRRTDARRGRGRVRTRCGIPRRGRLIGAQSGSARAVDGRTSAAGTRRRALPRSRQDDPGLARGPGVAPGPGAASGPRGRGAGEGPGRSDADGLRRLAGQPESGTASVGTAGSVSVPGASGLIRNRMSVATHATTTTMLDHW